MAIERILIVDDNDANMLFLEMLFKDLEYENVSTARTGEEGLDLLNKNHIQFVVVAWEMAGIPGTLFIQKARQSRKRRYLPCMIYSRRMGEEDVKLTEQLGFPDILPMPFDKEAAAEKIKAAIERENNLDPIENTLRKIEGYLSMEKPQEALKLVTPQLTKPGDFLARAQADVGQIWLKMGKLDKAEEAVNASLAVDDTYAPAIQLKAKICSRQGKHDEAIDLLMKLHKECPANLTTRVNLGTAYVEADRIDEAKQVFQDVTNEDPDNQSAKDQMAVVAFKEGDMSLASQLVAETEAGDELARVFNSMAIAQVQKSSYEEAIVTYKNATNLLADKARLHLLVYNHGLALRKKGDLQDALRKLGESYILNPEFEKAYAALARVHKEMKEKKIPADKDVVKEIKTARERWKKSSGEPAA